jgi:hypothetical protein
MKYFSMTCVLLCGLFASVVTANANVQPNVAVKMRNSGYTMGDLMPMHVQIKLPKNSTLDKERLPLVGRVKPWMDIREMKVQEKESGVIIDLTWQIFATVEIAQILKTPEISLKTAEKPEITILIPAQAFYYSPVFPMPPLKEIKRRENLAPPLIDEQTPFLGFIVSSILLILSLTVLIWLKNLIPWLPYKAGPIAKLAKKLKPEIRKLNSTKSFNLTQLREIHQALNETAGISLYPNNLEFLFENAPYLIPEKNAMTTFFHRSWAQFYPSNQPSSMVIDVVETVRWVERSALAERLFRRQKTLSAKR